jgi:hypothetical protein
MKYSVQIVSVPDRNKLVAEIWFENQMIAEINQEKEKLELIIYFNHKERFLGLDYEDFMITLEDGKKKLKAIS